MRKRLLLCVAMLLVAASVVSAAGLDINWQGCIDDVGMTPIVPFSCLTNSNAGANNNNLTCSVTLAADMPYFQGSLGYIRIAVANGAIPAWWGNGCPGKLSPFRSTSLTSCLNDPYNGTGNVSPSGSNGIVYPLGGDVRTMGMLVVGTAVAGFEGNLLANYEYGLYQLNMNNAKTIGTGFCYGCSTPVSIQFYQMDTASLSGPYPGGTPLQQIITIGNVQQTVYWNTTFDPTRNATWGSVKALYR